MNIEELSKQIAEQRKIVEQIYISVEKTRKYFMWTMVATIITFVLPIVVIALMIPYLLNSISALTSTAGLGF